ncbi:MAG: DUF6261 family protein [Flavobacteriales bacterium]
MGKLKGSRLRNSEHIQFISDFVLICEQDEIVEAALQSTLIPLKNKLGFMNESSTTKDIGLSAKLFSYDKNRDSRYSGLKFSLKAATHHWDPLVVEAATKTLDYVNRHIKSIFNLNYQAETEKLKTLITILNDLEAEKGVLTTLNLQDWVTQLESENNKFNDLYITRTNTDSENQTTALSVLRSEVSSLYNNVLDLLNGLIVTKKAVGEDTSAFEKVLSSIDVLISKYNDLENLRK